MIDIHVQIGKYADEQFRFSSSAGCSPVITLMELITMVKVWPPFILSVRELNETTHLRQTEH